METADTSYGNRKRLQFISGHIQQIKPATILDFGCGTGLDITIPLAEAFPSVQMTGIDSDATSIDFAQKNRRSENVHFLENQALSASLTFDAILCSEVLEHVENPDQVLQYLSGKLTEDGILILTLPNGYGPFEFASLLQSLLEITRIIPFLRWLKRKFIPSRRTSPQDTLAVSPHINFFSYRHIRALLTACGFQILDRRPRTFLCGMGFDQLLFTQGLIHFNLTVADRLPFWMNSGWMFVLKKELPVQPEYRYRRNGWARFRRFLNEKACGL